MCRLESSDNLYQDTRTILARKEHRCNECHRTILAGEPFRKDFCVFEPGRAGSFNVCEHCAVLCDWLGRNCGGWIWGEVIPDIEEHAIEYKRTDLARLVVAAARRSWHRFKPNGYVGMPVPKLPKAIGAP